MLFLDTSVLIKVYFKEAGSEAVIARFTAPNQVLAASVLSFAAVHAAMARKHRNREISSAKLSTLRETFERDWENSINTVELNRQTTAALPGLVKAYPLKAADAVQLSAALWLQNSLAVEKYLGADRVLEFGVSDRILADSARKCGLVVFNPEEESQERL
jgi:predicted nucleic acid-binding protein